MEILLEFGLVLDVYPYHESLLMAQEENTYICKNRGDFVERAMKS